MRRSALPILIVACVVVAAVLAWIVTQRLFRPTAEEDAGPVTSELRTPGEFTKVDVTGHADIELVQGPRHEVAVEASPGAQEGIRTVVEGSTLRVTTHARGGWRPFHGPTRVPHIVITAPTFEAVALTGNQRLRAGALDVPALRIAAAGAANVKIDALKTDALRIAGSGAVKADLAGAANDLTISLSGAGDVQAARLVSETAKVSVSGAGKVVVNAAKTLRVSLSGAGSVEYLGNPEIKQSVSGLGRVKRREGEPGPARTQLRVALA
jgi:hypothetical protein